MRSCRFRNVFYNIADNTYAYFEHPEDPPEIKRGGQSTVLFDFQQRPLSPSSSVASHDTDPYFLSQAFVRGPGGIEMDVRTQNGPLPPLGDVYEQPGLSLVWHFHRNSAYSYGHCMLNDWLPIFVVLYHHFSEAVPPFKVLMQGDSSHVCQQYVDPFSRRAPAVKLNDLSAMASLAGKKWIHFQDLVFGDAGFWFVARTETQGHKTIPTQPSPLFNAVNWRLFRQAVYRAFDVGDGNSVALPGALSSLGPMHITVLDKPAGAARRIINVEAVVSHFQTVFPASVVTAVNFGKLTPLEQLRVMARTRVFITTQGSAGFRHVFLGRGARVILIGSPPDRLKNNWHFSSFFELPRFFPVADYKITKYPMDPAASEYSVVPDTSTPWKPLLPLWMRRVGEHWSVYNSMVTLNLTRMEGFLRAALHEVDEAGAVTA